MKFGLEQLKNTAHSVTLFIGVYHFFSLLVQGKFFFCIFFLLASSITGFVLYSSQQHKSDNLWLSLSSIMLLFIGFFLLLYNLKSPDFPPSIWFGLLIICSSIILSGATAFKLNVSVLIAYWGFSFFSSQATLIHFDHALAIGLLFIFVSIVSKFIASLQLQLSFAQSTDHLTGCMLPGRFIDELKTSAQINERYKTPFSVICIKYDTFFSSESELDTWLIELTHIYQSRLRSMDILCRFNTHKFMILLPNTLEENAIALCNDLKKCANAYEFSFKSSHINEPILTFSTQAYQVGEPLDEWLNRIQQ